MIFLFTHCQRLYSQAFVCDSFYENVNGIDTDTSLSKVYKLDALFKLKQQSEEQNCTNDSGYIFALIKIAKYEYSVNIDSAIKYSLIALDKYKRTLYPVSRKILVTAYFNLAIFYSSKSETAKSLTYYDTVLLFSRQYDPDYYVTKATYQLIYGYYSFGNYQKLYDVSTIAINNAKRTYDSVNLPFFLNYRAYSLLNGNHLEQALLDVDEAISISLITQKVSTISQSYEIKGLIYQEQKNFSQAEEIFKQIILALPHSPTNNLEFVLAYNALANLYYYGLNNYIKAKKVYLKMIGFAKRCSSERRPMLLLLAYGQLAKIAYQEQDYKKANIFYTKAFNFTNLKTSNFLFAKLSLSQITVMGYKEVMFPILFGKVNLLLRLIEQSHDKTVYCNSLLQTAMLVDSLITQTRFEHFDEATKLVWRDNTRDFFSNIIEYCYLKNDVYHAFYFIEKSRAALLFDKLNNLEASARLSNEELKKEENLQFKVAEIQQQLSILSFSSKQYQEVENNLSLTKDSLEHFIKSLEKKYPLYYQYKYADDVPTLQSLQKYLAKNNQSFIYYFMNDSAMYALAITKNKTNFIKISAPDFDSKQLSQFIRLCSDKQEFNHSHDLFCSLSQIIYNKLFKPLQIPKGNVAVCTDNFFIPFEALCSDDKGKHFLLNDYNFSYVYSARSLIKLFPSKAATGNFIGFAPVTFSSSLSVPDLTLSANALQNVGHYYSNDTLFTQEQATRNNFFTNASHYSVVTIFSHAKADTTDAEPELFMQDSVIHLSELQRLTNPAIQFVLLSACQTNIGKNATGEGIYSLARGFAAAGIPSVSATLWKADENAVYEISTIFNRYLSQGMNKSEALQKAKVDYLQHTDHEHTMPYYWANMVLIGSSQPVVLSSPNHWWLWISGVVTSVVLLAFLFYYFYYKKKKITNMNAN